MVEALTNLIEKAQNICFKITLGFSWILHFQIHEIRSFLKGMDYDHVLAIRSLSQF